MTILKMMWKIITGREFAKLITSMDYLQIYNDKADLLIVLGKTPNPEPNPEDIETARNCVLALKSIAPSESEFTLEEHEGNCVLSFKVDKQAKEGLSKVLKAK